MKSLKYLFTMSLMFLGLVCFAQSGQTVKALLVDEGSGEPVGFATVSLTPAGQTAVSKYAQSADDGRVTLNSVKGGKYTFKVDLMGYRPYSSEITVEGKTLDLGTIKLSLDATVLDAASVSAVGNPVIVKKDTVEYTASSFKTTDNDMLEDLLKKLPGVEVSDDGSITANGETISKIARRYGVSTTSLKRWNGLRSNRIRRGQRLKINTYVKVEADEDAEFTVTVNVTNTGDTDGKETVLWFIQDPVSSISRPVKELKHFEKRMIRAGETETFRFEIDPMKDLAYYDSEGVKHLEAGEFRIIVGDRTCSFILE